MRSWAQKAKENDADIVLFPELNLTGYVTAPIAAEISLPIRNRYHDMITSICDELSIIICYGFIEQENGICYCTQVIADRFGALGKQRKIHVPTQESKYWRSGRGIEVFAIDGTKIGISICRDSFFPEYQRTLYFKECEVVLMPFSYYNVPRLPRLFFSIRYGVTNGRKRDRKRVCKSAF